jgi:hypothetical protein
MITFDQLNILMCTLNTQSWKENNVFSPFFLPGQVRVILARERERYGIFRER